MASRYWLYKCNRDGGPAGYWGDWAVHVFASDAEIQWGGSYSTRSNEVRKRLDEDVHSGDTVVAYQTDDTAVIGFAVVTRMTGPVGSRRIWLRPIEFLDTPFEIHRLKYGTPLETSIAVNGMVMLRELLKPEMEALLQLTGVPKRVLLGKAKASGYRP